jgi:hypothetical protein
LRIRDWEDDAYLNAEALEARILDAVKNGEAGLSALSERTKRDLVRDKLRIKLVMECEQILTTNKILSPEQTARWILSKFSNQPPNVLRSVIFEMRILKFLYEKFGNQLTVLDVPSDQKLPPRTTDYAIKNRFSIELKALQGQAPEAVRSNLQKADQQHQATATAHGFSKRGMTFVLLPQSSLDELQNQQDQKQYIEKVIREIVLLVDPPAGDIDPISSTELVFLAVDEFVEEADGTSEWRLSVSVFGRDDGVPLNNKLPIELHGQVEQGAMLARVQTP